MTAPCKWLTGFGPDDLTSDVAAVTLQSRLAAVRQYLPLAARHADADIEHVHALRVWSRRAAAALSLYRDWLPRRQRKWMRKQMKRVRRAAGWARDCDVLIERLKRKWSDHAARRWLAELEAERAEAQKAIVAVHDRLTSDHRFAQRTDQLLEHVRTAAEARSWAPQACFGDWARERLRPTVDAFFAALPIDPMDEAALHQFRIRGKKLRYAMELFAGAFPDHFRTALYPAVEALQERLGEINDLVTARTRLRKEIERARGHHLRSRRRLLAEVNAQLAHAEQEFVKWWTPALSRELRDEFATVLDPNGAGLQGEADQAPAEPGLERLAS